MHKHGPSVNVDRAMPPFENTCRLITDFDINGDARRAHGSVVPGSRAKKGAATGVYLHEDFWRSLIAQPVDTVGDAVPRDEFCRKMQRDGS